MSTRTRRFCLTAGILLLSLLASPSWGWDSYLMLRAGGYAPQADDLDDWDTGPALELAYGFDVLPLLSGELSAGYYRTENSDDTLEVVPMTVAGKLHLPTPVLTPYAMVGGGAYYADADVSGLGTDDDWTFGYFAGAGLNFKLPLVILSLEGKYLVAQPELYGEDIDIDGLVVTVGAGLKW